MEFLEIEMAHFVFRRTLARLDSGSVPSSHRKSLSFYNSKFRWALMTASYHFIHSFKISLKYGFELWFEYLKNRYVRPTYFITIILILSYHCRILELNLKQYALLRNKVKLKNLTLKKRRMPIQQNPRAASHGRIKLTLLKTATQVFTKPRPATCKW